MLTSTVDLIGNYGFKVAKDIINFSLKNNCNEAAHELSTAVMFYLLDDFHKY